MSSNPTTTFKFFLADEIHRVSIASALPPLDQVLDSIMAIFGSFKSVDCIRVQYIDEDGDRVTVNTQVEWLEALEALKESSIKKIYLTDREEAKTVQENPRDIPNARFQPKKNFYVPREDVVTRVANGAEFRIPIQLGKQQRLSERLRLASTAKLESKEYSQALNLLKTTLRMQPNSELDLYNIACTYALMGNQDKAGAKLKRAIKCGFKDLAFIEQDKDLDSIREGTAYKEAIEALRAGPSASCPRRRDPQLGQVKSTLLKPDTKPQEKRAFMFRKLAPTTSPEVKAPQPEVPQVKQEQEQEQKQEQKQEQEQEQEQQKQVVESKPDPFAEKKKQLLEMGFDNEELLGELLEQKDGSVEAVAEILLGTKL